MEEDFNIGQVLSESFRIYFANFVRFTGLGLILFLPLHAFMYYMPRLILGGDGSYAPFIGVFIIVMILSILSQYTLIGAVIYGVFQQLRGGRVSLSGCISVGIQRFLPILGIAILTSLITGIGLLLLVVPGIIFYCVLWVAIPATVIERLGVGSSMSRSADLTKERRLSIFGLAFIMVLIGVGISLLVGAVGAAFSTAATDPVADPELATNLIGNFLNWIASALTYSLSAIVISVSYYHLRREKEGIGVEDIAAVFE